MDSKYLTMVQAILLVHVAGKGVSVPFGGFKHALLFGWDDLLTILPKVSTLSPLPGNPSCQAFDIINHISVTSCLKERMVMRGRKRETMIFS